MVLRYNDNLVPGGNEGPTAKHLNFGLIVGRTSPLGAHKLSMLLLLLLAFCLATFVAYSTFLNTSDKRLQTKLVTQQSGSATSTQSEVNDTSAPSNKAIANDDSGSSGTTTNTNSTTITVNGQSVPVPQNGSFNQTVDTPDGQTVVTGSSSHTTNTSGNTTSNSSSTTVHINSK